MPASTDPSSADPEPARLRRPAPPRTWRDRFEELADATGTTPGRIVAGAAVVVAGGVGALWLLRPPADPPDAALPYASTTVTPASTDTTVPEVLVVHVAGAVQTPGLHELPLGSRVADGERIYVLAVGETEPAIAVGGQGVGSDDTQAGPIDLNTADAEALDSLPGIGPATAAAIIQHRAEVGLFTSVDQLLDVPGIGEAKLEALRDLVTV